MSKGIARVIRAGARGSQRHLFPPKNDFNICARYGDFYLSLLLFVIPDGGRDIVCIVPAPRPAEPVVAAISK